MIKGPDWSLKLRNEIGQAVIGQNVVIERMLVALLANGQQVMLLTRNAQAASAQFDGRVRCISNMAALPPETRIDVIVNLAGARLVNGGDDGDNDG